MISWTRLLRGLLWCLLLNGCVTPAQVGQYPNQQQMVGKSQSVVLSCAGRPKTQSQEGTFLLLHYYREAPILEESQPVGKSSVSTMRHGCWATVVLVDDRVTDIHYRFVPSAFDASNDCEEIFEPCLP